MFSSEDKLWNVQKFTELSGPARILSGGNLTACYSRHRVQVSVWHNRKMVLQIPLHYPRPLCRARTNAVVFRSDANGGSNFRLRFASIGERVSFCTAISEVISVQVEKGPDSQNAQFSQGSQPFNTSQSCQGDSMGSGSQQMTSSLQSPWLTPPSSQMAWVGDSQGVSPHGTSGMYSSSSLRPSHPHDNKQMGSGGYGADVWETQPPLSNDALASPVNSGRLSHGNAALSQKTTAKRDSRVAGFSVPLKGPTETKRVQHEMSRPITNEYRGGWMGGESAVGKAEDRAVPTSAHYDDFSDASSIYSDSMFASQQSIGSQSLLESQSSLMGAEYTQAPSVPVLRESHTQTHMDSTGVDAGTQTDDSLLLTSDRDALREDIQRLLRTKQFVSVVEMLCSMVEEDEEIGHLIDVSLPWTHDLTSHIMDNTAAIDDGDVSDASSGTTQPMTSEDLDKLIEEVDEEAKWSTGQQEVVHVEEKCLADTILDEFDV